LHWNSASFKADVELGDAESADIGFWYEEVDFADLSICWEAFDLDFGLEEGK
jgi:hypothetical protein